jgi:hypothetical protein
MTRFWFASGGSIAATLLMSMSMQASAALTHYYTFDELTGTTASDSGSTPANGSLAANTGTPATPFTFDANAVPGVSAGSLKFESAERDAILLPDGTFAFGTSDFTVAMWIKRTEVGTVNEGLWGQDSSATGAAGSTWARVQGDDVRFLVDHGATATDVVVADTLTSTDWLHLTFVRRLDKLEIWVNGVGTVSSGNLPANYDINGTTGAGIGRYLAANTLTFNGAIDDFRVYDAALSASEIQTLVPEPSSLILLLLASSGFAAIRWRRLTESR